MASPPSAAFSTFCGRTTVTGTLQCNTNVIHLGVEQSTVVVHKSRQDLALKRGVLRSQACRPSETGTG